MSRKVFCVILAACCAAACISNPHMESELGVLESKLEDAPAEVLSSLSGMEHDIILFRPTRAAFALLYSQALDKNGILVRSDSIIAPAVRYYKRHGTPDQKFKACYYRGLISENAGLEEDAMEWFKKAETHLTPTSPPSLAGRLYTHKSTLYYNAYDYEDALENSQKSANYFLHGKDYFALAYSLLNNASIYTCRNELDLASKSLEELRDYWSYTNEGCKIAYYINCLNIAICRRSTEQAHNAIAKCRSEFPAYANSPELCLKIGEAFLFCDKPDSCALYLSKYDKNADNNSLNYYLLLSEYYESVGQYRKSLQALHNYISQSELEMSRIIDSDIKYIEERYTTELKALKERQKASIYLILLCVIAIVITIIIRQLCLKLSITERNYKEIREEWQTLTKVQQESTIIDADSMALLKKRLNLLDNVLLGYMSENPILTKAANAQISQLLKNKETFILETARVFAASRPHFVSFLKKADLSEREIGYCCLYIMGMYNKDSRPYFSKYESENLNNTIRAKLGLAHNGQKLRTYLNEQFSLLEVI